MSTIREYAQDCAAVFRHLRCVSATAFHAWAVLARLEQPRHPREILVMFCSDCDPAYEATARSLHRCIKPPAGWASSRLDPLPPPEGDLPE